MSLNDDQLRELLKRWKDIDPKANFEANVWRRIRLGKAEQPERITVAEWLRRLLPQPALAMATAVVVSAIIVFLVLSQDVKGGGLAGALGGGAVQSAFGGRSAESIANKIPGRLPLDLLKVPVRHLSKSIQYLITCPGLHRIYLLGALC
jgi:protein translocase SecG subunit